MLGNLVTAAHALRHVVAGELHVYSARVGAERPVDLEEPVHLGQDVAEPPRLVAARRLEGVAVHRVTDPGDRRPGSADRLDQGRQEVTDPRGSHPGDEGEPPGQAVRVERLGEREDLRGRGGGAQLDPDGVVDAAGEFDVRVTKGPGPLTDPQEVRRGVIPQPGVEIRSGQRVLIVQEQRLVAGVQLYGAQLLRVRAAGVHESEGPVDLAHQPLVVLARRAGPDEVLVPGVRPAQVRETAGCVGPAQVERDRGAVVSAQQPIRVRRPGLRGEVEAVDGVAAVGGQFDAVACLGLTGPRLGELAGHPGNLDDGHARPVGEDERHLQQRLQLGADRVGGRALERLRAVAALQDEGLAPRHRGQTFPQLVAFVGEDQRRQRRQLAGDRLQPLPVGPVGLLTCRQPPPGGRPGAFRHRGHGRGSCASGPNLITVSPYRPGRHSRPAAFRAR